MVYKILVLEALAVCGMLYLRFQPEVTFNGLTHTTATEQISLPKAAESAPVAVDKLPVRPITSVPAAVTGLTFPVAEHGPANVISVFGDKRGKTRLHEGIDIKAPRGTAVVATTTGFVERIREGGSGGKVVYLRGAAGRLYYYAHLDSWSVKEFDAVQPGDVLGTVGDTGNAKGTTPHLHFEIMVGKEKKSVDPLPFWVGA